MVHVAADVSKAEIAVFDGNTSFTIANQEASIDRMLAQLPPNSVVALEATGIYGELLAKKAYEKGHTVYVVQPSWIKAYRRSLGRRAKTDKIDAVQIREFVLQNSYKLHPYKPLSPELGRLRDLVRQRQAVADDLARARERYQALRMHPQFVKTLLDEYEELKKRIDKKIKEALALIPRAKVLLKVPGIGIQTAAGLIVALEHIPFQNEDAFVAYLGLDPVPNDSGNSHAPRRISKKGDPFLRRAAFMAAFAGCRTPAWAPRYNALKQKGLKPKQALIALAKKIAKVAFNLYRLQVEFDIAKVNPKSDLDTQI
jgi:transposase